MANTKSRWNKWFSGFISASMIIGLHHYYKYTEQAKFAEAYQQELSSSPALDTTAITPDKHHFFLEALEKTRPDSLRTDDAYYAAAKAAQNVK